MADPPASALASGTHAAADAGALVIEQVNPNPNTGIPNAVSLTVNTQNEDENENGHEEEEDVVDSFSLLPLHRPRYRPICDKIIILCGAIMAHHNAAVLPVEVIGELMAEMRKWQTDPSSLIPLVESYAHEIMCHNWNGGEGQEILSLFPSVVGPPDGNQFLAILQGALTPLLKMSVQDAHALLSEVYFHYSFFTPSDLKEHEPSPPLKPLDAFNMHWNSRVYILDNFRVGIIDYNKLAKFHGQFAAVYPKEQYLHQQIVTKEALPAIKYLLDQPVHEQPAMYYLFLDTVYSGDSAPSRYAIDAAKYMGITPNVLKTTLTKLRSSKLRKNAPAINNTMPLLVPDVNPELIFPAISKHGSSRSLITFESNMKKSYPYEFKIIRRFQAFLNKHCYCTPDKTKYNPRYQNNADDSMGDYYFMQYKVESYRTKLEKTGFIGSNPTGAGGDPDDSGDDGDPDDEFDPDGDSDPDDHDSFCEDDYKDMDGLRDLDKRALPKVALGYLFAVEDMRKIISWFGDNAVFLKAQAYQSSTEIRTLFREEGDLASYYNYHRKAKNKAKVCFCFSNVGAK